MAIINLNADSFYAASRKQSEDEVLKAASIAINEGAHILDLGACSSRPGAEIPSATTEWKRLEPALKVIRKHYPNQLISIDTFRSEIVEKAAAYQIQIVNDISAGSLDPNLWQTVAQHNFAYAMMHMRGKPKNMQELTSYPNGLLPEIIEYFKLKLHKMSQLGIENCILDPGFGFAKTVQQNYELLKNLNELEQFNLPILAGVSRKSMLYKPLEITANEALNATTAAHMIALEKGAKILRVHDVKAAAEAIKIYTFAQNPGECYS